MPLAIPSTDHVSKCSVRPYLENDIDSNHDKKEEEEEESSAFLLASLDPEAIPVISSSTSLSSSSSSEEYDTGPVDPIRCSRCMAYLNPFTKFPNAQSDSYDYYHCNFCSSKNSVQTAVSASGLGTGSSSDSLSPSSQVRNNVDLLYLPTRYGTVEYEVGGKYNIRTNMVRPIHVYGVDCTDIVKLQVYLHVVKDVGIEIRKDWFRQHHRMGYGGGGGGGSYVDGTATFQKREGNSRKKKQQRQKEKQKRPRVGMFFFHQNLILFPYLERRKKQKGERREEDDRDHGRDDDENEHDTNPKEYELSIAIMSDVTDGPFAPLPLDVWTFDVGTELGLTLWKRYVEEVPDLIQKILEPYNDVTDGGSSAGMKATHGFDGRGLNCGGAALAVLADALRDSGGSGTLLTSNRPNFGAGFLRDREGGSDQIYSRSLSEKSLYVPLQQHGTNKDLYFSDRGDEKSAKFYRALGEQCAQNRVAIDIVITTSNNSYKKKFLDVATLGEFCRITCGRLKWLKCSDGLELATGESSYGLQLKEELLRSAVSFMGTDAVFKVRCSAGVQIKSYLPLVTPGVIVDNAILDSPEVELSRVTPDTCIPILLEHKVGGIPSERGMNGKKLGENPIVYFQSALLYTTRTGHRRVRVTTLALRTATEVAAIFRSADFGAVTAMMTRQAVCDLHDPDNGTPHNARNEVVQRCVNILANYRMYTAAKSSPSGQLILPETLQLLPLFCLSLKKSPMIRQSVGKNAAGVRIGKPSPNADERAYYLLFGASVSPSMAMLLVHPNVFPITCLKDGEGEWVFPSSATGTFQQRSVEENKVYEASIQPYVQLPRIVQPSVACLEEDGIYIIDDGLSLFVYVGREVSSDVRKELLFYSDCPQIGDISGAQRVIYKTISTSSDYGKRVMRMIWQMRTFCSTSGNASSVRPTFSPLFLIMAKGQDVDDRTNQAEEHVMSLLVDDSTNEEGGYVDFLCLLHRRIREAIEKSRA